MPPDRRGSQSESQDPANNIRKGVTSIFPCSFPLAISTRILKRFWGRIRDRRKAARFQQPRFSTKLILLLIGQFLVIRGYYFIDKRFGVLMEMI